MPKVIAVASQKGGVAKTTTVLNLGCALSKLGKRVLLIDYDPQANLTMCLGINEPDELDNTIFTLMKKSVEEENIANIKDYVMSYDGVDLIPCNIELSSMEMTLVNIMSREQILKSIVQEVKDDYDYVLIDCAPSLGILTINALAASDSVLIPATPQFLSAKGLEMLLMSVYRVKRKINPAIKIEGIIITMLNQRTNLSKNILNLIDNSYGERLRIYENKIPMSVKIGESLYHSKTVIDYTPNSKVAIAYRNFAKEFIAHE